jgi:hypothetical protein
MDKGSDGTSCTCVVTEYHYHERPDYAIQVSYFPKDRLLRQFKELLRAYRQFHAGTFPQDEAEDFEKASKVALDTFKAAFRDQSSMTEDFLRQTDASIVESTFSSWVTQSAPQDFHDAGSDLNAQMQRINDEEECKRRVRELTSESSGLSGAASWPYIKMVKYESQSLLRDIADSHQGLRLRSCLEQGPHFRRPSR